MGPRLRGDADRRAFFLNGLPAYFIVAVMSK
jgi:hypothetical protein